MRKAVGSAIIAALIAPIWSAPSSSAGTVSPAVPATASASDVSFNGDLSHWWDGGRHTWDVVIVHNTTKWVSHSLYQSPCYGGHHGYYLRVLAQTAYRNDRSTFLGAVKSTTWTYVQVTVRLYHCYSYELTAPAYAILGAVNWDSGYGDGARRNGGTMRVCGYFLTPSCTASPGYTDPNPTSLRWIDRYTGRDPNRYGTFWHPYVTWKVTDPTGRQFANSLPAPRERLVD